MVAYLLEEIGLSLKDLDYFYVAGAFGTHLNLTSAITVGMYPDLDHDKIICHENTSLKVAYKKKYYKIIIISTWSIKLLSLIQIIFTLTNM